jgi:hypothetical protein
MKLATLQRTRILGDRSADFQSAWPPPDSATKMNPATLQRTAMKPILCSLALLAAAGLFQGCATSRPKQPNPTADDARAYFEVLRSDFNAEKVRLLNQVMKLTVAEADQFWPRYRAYEKELACIGDRKLALIVEFMRHHKTGTLTDQNAQTLAVQFLQNAQDRLDLWKKYHQQISDAVSPVRAAQFLQVENQMAIFVDLNIASEMPVIGTSPERH